jgi:hypothetical protein
VWIVYVAFFWLLYKLSKRIVMAIDRERKINESMHRHPSSYIPSLSGIELEEAQSFLQERGHCGITDGKGHVCTLSYHHTYSEDTVYPYHQQQCFGGGPNDGAVFATWFDWSGADNG